ncbi:MAG: hypothetical protein DME69_08855 [Verrucomicrobia bacterium]|nr:MAG: hypothetical protein DME69_08855 [Verrucomicrobiota bacterium]
MQVTGNANAARADISNVRAMAPTALSALSPRLPRQLISNRRLLISLSADSRGTRERALRVAKFPVRASGNRTPS